jgi:hypothetical protein
VATLNEDGNILANCVVCNGARSSFVWKEQGHVFGLFTKPDPIHPGIAIEYKLVRCSSCYTGALAVTRTASGPTTAQTLLDFHPESFDSLPLPDAVPVGIMYEFREAEQCLKSICIRAAAGLFRSVLDKALRANGYKLKPGTTLEQQIDLAVKDGVITLARGQRAHDEIRVLGNDVLHDEWHEIPVADVEAAHRYSQRILEDLYDDRASVEKLLMKGGRIDADGKPIAAQPTLALTSP